MLTCILKGSEIRDLLTLHRTLAQSLAFPQWYGNNLDALYDCLTDLHEPAKITVEEPEMLRERLGGYADRLRRVLLDSADENGCLEIDWPED